MTQSESNDGRTGIARVYCLQCRRRKTIPESPRALPRTLRTGCSQCGRITRFKLIGVP
jgi:RNase P subunit RPR2